LPHRAFVRCANSGIGGNRVLSEGAFRPDQRAGALDRDALDVPGVRHVIVLEGINDIGNVRARTRRRPPPISSPPTSSGSSARARGVTIYGATLTPSRAAYFTKEGAPSGRLSTIDPHGPGLRRREDFDAATRDPASVGVPGPA
jgi:hypothetical protein